MFSDLELLRAYAKGHSEPAFAELVRRNAGLAMSLHRDGNSWRLFVPAQAVDLFGVPAQ